MKKKIITSMLAFTFLGSSLSVYADEVDTLKSKINDSQNEKKALEQEKHKVEGEMNDIESKIAELNKVLEETEGKIQKTEAKINQLKEDIIKTEAEIKRLELELEKKKEILARNLQLMEQKGNASFLEFLFTSENVSELLSRFSTLKDVAKANENLYEEVRVQSEMVKAKKEKLVSQKAEQENEKKKLDSLKEEQKMAKAEQQRLLKILEEEYAHIESEINAQDAAIASINSQIAGIIAEREAARKAREAEAARLAAEAKKTGTPAPTPPASNDIIGSGFSNPVSPGTYVVSSNFGWRTHPITGGQKLHGGIDLAGPVGTPIYAADGGTVLYSGAASGFGNWIVIDHNNGYLTVYGHMYANQLYVSPGQQVSKGQHIAGIGNSGGSTGPHLHFEIHRGGLGNGKQDPRNFIGF